MELHPPDRVLAVADRHDLARVIHRHDLQLGGEVLPRNGEGMVQPGLERGGEPFEDARARVGDRGGPAVRGPSGPPYAAAMHWCPRHTPRIGTAAPSRVTTSGEIPASAGEHGPGEMTMCDGASAATSSTPTSSFRTVTVRSPSRLRYRARLWTNES